MTAMQTRLIDVVLAEVSYDITRDWAKDIVDAILTELENPTEAMVEAMVAEYRSCGGGDHVVMPLLYGAAIRAATAPPETLPVDESDVEVVRFLLADLLSLGDKQPTPEMIARGIVKRLQLNHRRRGVKWLRREVRGVMGLDATRLRIFCEEWDAAPWPGEEE